MAETTGIQWCDATFNPWRGCDKVSEGCKFCYAEQLVTTRHQLPVWGAQAPRKIAAESAWKLPLRWDRMAQRHPDLCLKCGQRSRGLELCIYPPLARQHDSGKPGDFSDPRTIAYRDAYNAAKSQGEEYRTGLPSEALRMVCREWEQESTGDIIEMRGGVENYARWTMGPQLNWFTPMAQHEVSPPGWRLRPLNRTWASVEKEAAELPAFLEFCTTYAEQSKKEDT